MPNAILLLGAGFSKNWNRLIASEVTNDLMAQLQNDANLLALLHRLNFEDALAQVQSDYLHSRTAETEARLTAFQAALSGTFDRMNRGFQAQQFEFSNAVARSLGRFLTGLDAIFTLNQDLLLELHYHRRENVALWHNTRWIGAEMPGLRPLPVTDHFDRTSNKWRPQDPFQPDARMQPYYKLHGSSGWLTDDGQPLLVIGRDKPGTIAQHRSCIGPISSSKAICTATTRARWWSAMDSVTSTLTKVWSMLIKREN